MVHGLRKSKIMSSDKVFPTVRVIVVNYESGPLLAHCLESLSRQLFAGFEAIVVDNGSGDGSLNGAVPDDPRFSVLAPGENIGFGAANNRAAAGATTPFLATLNPDAYPEPGWLDALLGAAERYPDAVLFGSTQIDAKDPSLFDGVGDPYFAFGVAWRGEHGRASRNPAPGGAVFAPCAAAALYRTEPFQRVGGFDESFFCFYEDVDLAFRLRLMGGQCVQVADAVVHHVGSTSTGTDTPFASYHLTRNQIWTFLKNIPGPLLWALLPGHVLVQILVLLRGMTKGQGPAMFRGLRDALVGLGSVLRARRKVQGARQVAWWTIARALTWSPAKWLGRRSDLRPLP